MRISIVIDGNLVNGAAMGASDGLATVIRGYRVKKRIAAMIANVGFHDKFSLVVWGFLRPIFIV
jgi:hypothetical protein